MAANIRGAIKTLLEADAQLTALVGTRIYSDELPESDDTWPALMFERISGHVRQTLAGGLTGLTDARYTFHVFGLSQAQVEAVRACLYRILPGAARDVTVGAETVQIRGVDTDDVVDYYGPTTSPDLKHYLVDFHIWYREEFA